jgi:hypothetical protein
MKLVPLLVVGSLAANVALVAAFVARPSLAPPAFRNYFDRGASARAEANSAQTQASAAAAQARLATVRAATDRSQLWPALRSDDLPGLVARLRAAGFPPNLVRAIVSAEIEGRFRSKAMELVGAVEDVPFWKSDPSSMFGNQAFFDKYSQIYRDRSKLLRELIGDDFYAWAGSNPTTAQRRQFGDIPKAKIDQIQRINDDYAEMIAQVRAAMQGITLPEDRAKLALLEREKRTDLAAILTPAELEDYEMHSSQTTMRLRNLLTTMNATEDEFRAIYRIQSAFADKINFPQGTTFISAEMTADRRAAQLEAGNQIKGVLGEQRYGDYVRAGSTEYQQLARLAQRDNVSTETTIRAFGLRDAASVESNRIFADTALSVDEKRTALQTLGQNTRTQLVGTLGATVGNAYLQVANTWLTRMEQGTAVTFGPDNSTNYKNLPPASRPAPTPTK